MLLIEENNISFQYDQQNENLEDYLNNSSFPYLIISHDREFLDSCVSETWEIESGNLRNFTGNYSFYKNQLEMEYKKNAFS